MGGTTTQDTGHQRHRHQEQRGWHDGRQEGRGDDKAEDEGMTTAAARTTREREGEGERRGDHGDDDTKQARGEKGG
jgi:hypothetical protein